MPAASAASASRSRRSRGARTSCTTSGCASSTGRISPRTRWPSSSASRSTTTWRRWSTVSTTWPTKSTASCSKTFDRLNGLHDAANSIATVVSTRVLRPQHAVAWAAFFNFVAFLIFGSHVAQTIGTGIVSADIVDPRVVFGALIGAIAWNIITWAMGIPSSSSHALIGGLVGAGVAKVGVSAIVWGGLAKTSAAIVLSPLMGFFLAMLLFLLVTWLFARYTPYAVDRLFRMLQFASASL